MARWRVRRDPGGKRDGKRGRGTDGDMPPEKATADIAVVGAETAGSDPKDLKLRPGQSSLHA